MKKEGQGVWGIVLGLGFFARKYREDVAISVSSSGQTKWGLYGCRERTLSSSSTSGNINSHCRLNP